MNQRNFRYGIASLVLIFIATLSLAQSIKVALLGTGGPVPSIERFGPSTLVEAGGQKLLFDCGRGAGQRLWQLKTRLAVYSHIILLTVDPALPPPTLSDLLRRTAITYKGPLQIGEDLLTIDIGEQVKVSTFTPPAAKPTEVLKAGK